MSRRTVIAGATYYPDTSLPMGLPAGALQPIRRDSALERFFRGGGGHPSSPFAVMMAGLLVAALLLGGVIVEIISIMRWMP